MEIPQKYRSARLYHRDLDRLSRFADLTGPWALQVYPREWKGGVGSTHTTKEPHHKRIRAALCSTEPPVTDLGPDAMDAIGIGLYALGRVGKGGIKP